jgi:hypothetical protein
VRGRGSSKVPSQPFLFRHPAAASQSLVIHRGRHPWIDDIDYAITDRTPDFTLLGDWGVIGPMGTGLGRGNDDV